MEVAPLAEGEVVVDAVALEGMAAAAKAHTMVAGRVAAKVAAMAEVGRAAVPMGGDAECRDSRGS